MYDKEAVHKRRPQSGGERVFKCKRPHFLVQKASEFSKFIVCPHGQEGVEPVRTRRKGLIFRVFVWTSFMDGP